MKIMIDPGHGGSDSGAVSGMYMEKDLNLTASFFLAGVLNSLRHKVAFTRVADEDVALSYRVRQANNAGSDLFVSVHCNSFISPEPSGFEVYHYLGSKAGKRYAAGIVDRLKQGCFDMHGTGVVGSSFYVLERTRMPAVLLELGYMSSPGDLGKLRDSIYLSVMMRGIGKAIDGVKA